MKLIGLISCDTIPASASAAITELTANASLTFAGTITSDGTNQTIGYTYNPGAADLDFIQIGDSLVVTYTVKVNDGTADSGTQDLVITITGENDEPVLSAITAPTAVVELVDASAQDLAAITGDQSSVEMMRQEFDRRRQYMLQRLRAMDGVTCSEPLGAFYTFPQVSAYYGRSLDGPPINGSLDFCNTLLDQAKLALVPGVAFGNDGHVRLSYAASMDDITEAMNRLEWFLGQLE